jgi:hypothetical protein
MKGSPVGIFELCKQLDKKVMGDSYGLYFQIIPFNSWVLLELHLYSYIILACFAGAGIRGQREHHEHDYDNQGQTGYQVHPRLQEGHQAVVVGALDYHHHVTVEHL